MIHRLRTLEVLLEDVTNVEVAGCSLVLRRSVRLRRLWVRFH